MKAVVLDNSEKEATVMTHDGDIIGVKNRNYDIGQEITIRTNLTALPAKVYKFAPVAAVAAVFVVIAGGFRTYFDPYGTVSLDINPSIEYTINRFDRVLDVNGMNDDGSDILASINTDGIINRNIEDAVDKTLEQIEADGYIEDDDENYVVVTANTKKEEHTDELLSKLDSRVRNFEKTEPQMFKVTDDEISEAHKQGISAGKKKMVDTLENESNGSIDREEWNKKSVREIVKERDRIRNKPSEEEQKQTDEKTETPDNGSEHSFSKDEPAYITTDEQSVKLQTEPNEKVPDKKDREEPEDRPETGEQLRPDEPEQEHQPDDRKIPDGQEHPGEWQSGPSPDDGNNNPPDLPSDDRDHGDMREDQPPERQSAPEGPPR